jgi:Mg-chelatase subunit ChlD
LLTSLESLFGRSVDFDAPHYLLLLLLLPLIALIGRRSLAALGSWRRRFTILLRVVVATLLIVALAEPNWQTIIHRLSVMFVVDASSSIYRGELDSALKYVSAAATTRDKTRGDRAGLVVFGRDPAVEIPPVDASWQVSKLETSLDPRFTNLESALRMVQASAPPDSACRVVIVSDGNENIGHALEQARHMQATGIGIDCVPVSYERRGEVAVEKLVVPTDVRRGTPFTLSAVLNNAADRPVVGKLVISRTQSGAKQSVAEEPVTLEPGKRVFTIRQELAESGMATYDVRFFPHAPADDAHTENNLATGFSHVTGKGRVLLIEDAAQAGRFDAFVRLLRQNGIEVAITDTCRAFDSLADLQEFDCVILADVARVSGEPPAELTQISDEQIHALVQNTEHFGSGLIVLGGPNSYGAGGWTNSELEKALPVDFQIENMKVNPVGALMLVIDSSGSMIGEKIAWSKAAAIAATDMLGPRDYIGVVTFDSEAHWLVPMQRSADRDRIKAGIDRLGAAGGTDMMPALKEAYRAIQGVNASLKHVIVLTDGHTPNANFQGLVSSMRNRKITTTGVAVGNDADRVLLADIGQRGGGKFYTVTNPKAIPRIFMREARRVAMPLVFEDAAGISAQVSTLGDLLAGIKGPLPPVTGYVLTTVKGSPLVDVLVATPRQPAPNAAILASWQFGLGRAVALTTDVGQRWATSWTEWDNYEKLMLQTVRWTMRSHDVSATFALATDARDGFIDVAVTALDRDDPKANTLAAMGTAVLPDGTTQTFTLEQSAPGRYTAKVPATTPGNYYLSVSGSERAAPLRSAISINSTAEFERLASNDGYLAEIAEGVPTGGERGKLIQAPKGIADTRGLLATDVFRPGIAPARSRNPAWPTLLLVTSVLFLGDVFCRRVTVAFDWIPVLAARIGLVHGAPALAAVDTARMERLRASKSSATAYYASEQAEATRTAVEYDHIREAIAEAQTFSAAPLVPPEPSVAGAPLTADVEPAEDFTNRLLKAKKRIRDELDR